MGWIATYYGLSLGIPEGNLFLRTCIESWGVGVTLVGAKSAACVFLLSLYKVAYLSLSQWGLLLTAVSYVMCSFLPWCVMLFM